MTATYQLPVFALHSHQGIVLVTLAVCTFRADADALQQVADMMHLKPVHIELCPLERLRP